VRKGLVVSRTSSPVAWILGVVALHGLGCSASPGDPADAGNAAPDVGAPYDGPFDLPDGHPVTVPLSGCAGPGYAANFEVGSEAFQLTIDTGSGTLAVASNQCTNCDVSKVYTPGTGAVDQDEPTSDTYLLDISWTGEIFSDAVKLVGVDPSLKLDFAAIDSQSGFFNDGGCAFGATPFAPQGIVGFGPPGLAKQGTDAFLTKLFGTGAVPEVFAVEFCGAGGQLMVGGVDPAKGSLSGAARYTQLMSPSYYSVKLTNLELTGTSLSFGESDFGTTVVDTGTSVLDLPPEVFTSLSSKIENLAAFATCFGNMTGWLGTTTCLSCPSLNRDQIDAQFPTLTLSFPDAAGGTLSLALKATDSYLPATMSDGTTFYCSGIHNNQGTTAASTILGSAAMLGHVVIFDLADGKLGFAPQTYCP
jgi:hypothetical protein